MLKVLEKPVMMTEEDHYQSSLEAAYLEAERGIGYSEEAILKWMHSWGTANELPPPDLDVFPK